MTAWAGALHNMKGPVYLSKYLTLYALSLTYTKQNLRFLSLREGIFLMQG